MEFTRQNHADELMSSVYNKYCNDELTDITVVCGDTRIQCHKIILSASPYFNAIFRSPLADCNKGKDETEIKDVTAEALKIVIDYIYTGKIKVDESTLTEILHAADMLMIEDVKMFAEEFIIKAINSDNAIELSLLSQRYGLQKACDSIITFIDDNLINILKSKAALDIGCMNLKDLLYSDTIRRNYADDILNYITAWIKHDCEERKDHLLDIVSFLNLQACSIKQLHQFHKDNKSLLSKDCTDILFETISHLYTDEEIKRSMRLIIIGGGIKKDDGYYNNLQFYVSTLGNNSYEKHSLQVNSCYKASSICLCDKNVIMITGGRNTANDKPTNMCKLLDITSKQIEDKSELNQARYGHQSVKLGGNVYVIGGIDDQDKGLDSIECYIDSKWIQKSHMLHSIARPRSTAIGNVIYTFGYSGDTKLVGQCYDISTDKWSLIKPPPSDIYNTVAIAHDQCLYICGGDKSALKYSPNTDTWTELTKPKAVHRDPSALINDGLLYIMGGVDGNDDPTDVIECYDPEKNQWTVMDWKLPDCLFRHYSFMVSL